MKLVCIEHVPYEGPGCIEELARARNFHITPVRTYEPGFMFPQADDIDLLVVMGGPMGIYDADIYPWLVPEKEFIKCAIDANIKIIGICLGAQLLADVLGAPVVKNRFRETGWFPVKPDSSYSGLLSGIFDDSPEVFHWHGDTFGIPEGCMRMCSSEACANQGFDFEGRAFGLQFHLETTPASAAALVNNCRDEIAAGGEYVQEEKAILADRSKYEKINILMEEVFSRISGI